MTITKKSPGAYCFCGHRLDTHSQRRLPRKVTKRGKTCEICPTPAVYKKDKAYWDEAGEVSCAGFLWSGEGEEDEE